MDIAQMTIKEALRGMKKRFFSSFELTKAYLQRIKKYDQKIHSFITVCEKEALVMASEADKLLVTKQDKPLLGIPVAIKDNFLTKGILTTAASRVLSNYIPSYEATVVRKLREAGAVIIGKTNLDAWGHGSSGEHTIFGETHNPYDYSRVTGGSSSGSGAAVAADFCLAATGSDTGGSNRQPAAYCNVVGLKPTYGRTSRYGVIAMASSTDCMGILTKTIWDAARCLSIMAGFDPWDATSSQEARQKYEQGLTRARKFKIGLPKEYFQDLETEIAKVTMKAINLLKKRGNQIIELSMPLAKYAYPIYALITFPEISSNLARFDGIRYGKGRAGFQDEAKRRIMIGTHALRSGYYDQYYARALKGRTLLCREYEKAFEKVEVIVAPVFPFPPFKHKEREKDPLKMYLSDVLTVTANLTGNPAISVPIEFVNGLPSGLQLIGPHFQEKRLFRLGKVIEEELEMYKIRPILKS